MLTKAFARIGQSPFGFLILGAVTTVVALGTYLAAGQSALRATAGATRGAVARIGPSVLPDLPRS